MTLAALMAAVTSFGAPPDHVAVARVVLAAVLGAGVGWERERHGRAAGLRTHLLLCVGCALIMLVSLYVPAKLAQEPPQSVVRADPTRMAAQVMSGLGFLGAGAIIALGQRIRGLTTAASIWVTAAIGLAVGAGYILAAVFTWMVVMFALLVLKQLEAAMKARDQFIALRLEFASPRARFQQIETSLRAQALQVLDFTVDREGEAVGYNLNLRYQRAVDFERTTEALSDCLKDQDLRKIVWT
jgi:putative Mg2+ transporter-C (MgtC) family protein